MMRVMFMVFVCCVVAQDNPVHRQKRWYAQVIFSWNHNHTCLPCDRTLQPTLTNMSFEIPDYYPSKGSAFVLIVSDSEVLIATAAHNTRHDGNPSKHCTARDAVMALFIVFVVLSVVGFLSYAASVCRDMQNSLSVLVLGALVTVVLALVGICTVLTLTILCPSTIAQDITISLPPTETLEEVVPTYH
eukprot:TRINITY_DN104502_c0_g1_i1.p1 TRINITY_DN104502_c0_g1~~TRINITY_DN104502_c0_g1_i1.p1  ORF type:complete len:188 (-),score=2.89 TRINITY_DN104502_c0_g1_i1:9-572(-)